MNTRTVFPISGILRFDFTIKAFRRKDGGELSAMVRKNLPEVSSLTAEIGPIWSLP
jgi:hypothetical protein